MRTVVLSVLVVLLAPLGIARILAPGIIERTIERTFERAPGVYATVEDVDLALWRGAYQIEGLVVESEVDGVRAPLLRLRSLAIELPWRPLLEGRLHAELDIDAPVLNVVASERDPEVEDLESPVQESVLERIEGTNPFLLARFSVRDGTLRYRNAHVDPPVDITVEGIRIDGHDFANRAEGTRERPARVEATGTALGSGETRLSLRVDPFAARPHFGLDLEVEQIPLAALSELLEAQAGFDVEDGTLSLFAEARAFDGRFDGYVKPLLRGVDVVGEEESHESIWQAVWENLVGAAAEVLENQPADQVAGRLEIAGRFADPELNTFGAVLSVLENAIASAFRPRLEGLDPIERPDSASSRASERLLFVDSSGDSRGFRGEAGRPVRLGRPRPPQGWHGVCFSRSPVKEVTWTFSGFSWRFCSRPSACSCRSGSARSSGSTSC